MVALKLTVTVLAEAGLKAYEAEATMSVNVEPLVLACTENVWLRAPQPVGSLATTLLTLTEAARSTWIHCGKALLALSQYVAWLPSLALPAP